MRSFSQSVWFYILLTLSLPSPPPPHASSVSGLRATTSIAVRNSMTRCRPWAGRVIWDRQGVVAGKPNPRGERLPSSVSSSAKASVLRSLLGILSGGLGGVG